MDFFIDFFSDPDDILHYFLVEGIPEDERDCTFRIGDEDDSA
jgi:hypothetical protein